MNQLRHGADRPKVSSLLRAKQHGAAVLAELLLLGLMALARLQWGHIAFGSDHVTVGFILYNAKNIVVIFGAVDLISAAYYLIRWLQMGRPSSPDDNNSLFSDSEGGERSPLKASLAMLGCMAVILTAALVLWL